MAYVFAGRYSEIFMLSSGALLRNKQINVYLRGTTTFATLYTSRTKSATASNPITTDGNGNGNFFADPGEYDLNFQGTTIPVTVDDDPGEPSASGLVDYDYTTHSFVDSTGGTLVDLTLPGGTVKAGDMLRMSFNGFFWNDVAAVGSFTFSVKVGGTTIFGPDPITMASLATQQQYWCVTEIGVIVPAALGEKRSITWLHTGDPGGVQEPTSGGAPIITRTLETGLTEDLTVEKHITAAIAMTAHVDRYVECTMATLELVKA